MSPLRSAELKSFRNRRLVLPYQRKSDDNPKSLTYRIGHQIQLGYNPDVRLRGLVYAQHAIASAPVGCVLWLHSQPFTYSHCERVSTSAGRFVARKCRKSRVDAGWLRQPISAVDSPQFGFRLSYRSFPLPLLFEERPGVMLPGRCFPEFLLEECY
jgi:hypothetical protein